MTWEEAETKADKIIADMKEAITEADASSDKTAGSSAYKSRLVAAENIKKAIKELRARGAEYMALYGEAVPSYIECEFEMMDDVMIL